MQLVADGVELWDPMKQKDIGRDEVIERFGVGPELVCDALALIGDTSDNVPGVPGIGPKGAAQLLHRVRLARGPARQSRPDQAAQAARGAAAERRARRACPTAWSASTTTRRCRSALDELRRPAARPRRAAAVPAGERLQSLVRGSRAWRPRPRRSGRRGARQRPPSAGSPPSPTLAELDAILARARDAGLLAHRHRDHLARPVAAKLVGVCLAVSRARASTCRWRHVDEFGQRRDGQLDLPEVIERLRPVLVDPSVLKIGHNIKYDQGMLARYGLERHARSTTPC